MNGRHREPIMEALRERFVDSIPQFQTVSRRAKDIGNVPASDMPALFIIEPHENVERGIGQTPIKSTIEVELWIFINDGRDPNAVPITILNGLLDSIDAALAPDLPIPFNQNCTLGGLVSDCWIEGKITKAPGDLDGLGMAIVPLKILVP